MFVSLWHVSVVNVGVTYGLFHWTINMNNREMITDVSLYETLESIMYVRKTICEYVINQGGLWLL